MVRMGKLPDCVTVPAPMAYSTFGDQNEDVVTNGSETVRFSQLIKDRSGYRYMEDLGTEPPVWYLPPRPHLRWREALKILPEEIKERYKDVGLDG